MSSAPIASQVLDEAADWLMQLNDSSVTDADRAACERWRQSDPEHARAWSRAELLLQKLGGLPPQLAMPALSRPAASNRRAAVARLAALLAVAPVGWAAWQLAGRHAAMERHHTAKGERLDMTLPDGTRLSLSTATAVDVKFDSVQRTLYLRCGAVLASTAADPLGRPFRVVTAEGTLLALGTRFSVRQEDGRSHIAVLESAVRIQPRRADGSVPPLTLQAGQQVFFTASDVAAVTPADDSVVAWTRGMLLADKMRLADFCAELAQWHPGFVRCDAAVANLRVSGAFPVAEPERALSMLVSTYPVDAATRLRGYWVTLVAR